MHRRQVGDVVRDDERLDLFPGVSVEASRVLL
jgi:hypothetical protein